MKTIFVCSAIAFLLLIFIQFFITETNNNKALKNDQISFGQCMVCKQISGYALSK